VKNISVNLFNITEENDQYIHLSLSQRDIDNVSLKTLEHDKLNHAIDISSVNSKDVVLLKYHISEYERLSKMSDRITLDQFLKLMSSFLNVLCNCHYWFLNYRNFIFNREYVFINKQDMQLKLLYCPCNIIEDNHDYKQLILQLLNFLTNDYMDIKVEILSAMVEDEISPYKLSGLIKRLSNKVNKKDTHYEETVIDKKSVQLCADKPQIQERKGLLKWLFRKEDKETSERKPPYKKENDFFQKLSRNLPEEVFFLELVRNETSKKLPRLIELDLSSGAITLGRNVKGARIIEKSYMFSSNIKEISPSHCVIERVNRTIYLSDMHSEDGTYLNGIKLQPEKKYELNIGDKVNISRKVQYEANIKY